MKLNHKYERITRRNLLASASSSHPVIFLKDSSTFNCSDDSFSFSMVILNFLFLLFSQAETQLRERERERAEKKNIYVSTTLHALDSLDLPARRASTRRERVRERLRLIFRFHARSRR